MIYDCFSDYQNILLNKTEPKFLYKIYLEILSYNTNKLNR